MTKICAKYDKKRLLLQVGRGILHILKVRTSFPSGRLAGALLAAATWPAWAGDQIQSYTVPKEHPAPPPTAVAPANGSPDIPVNAAPIHWAVPAGWEEKPSDGFRLGSFAIKGQNGGKAEVAITSFPGKVGTELSNVNRWRGELGLAAVEQIDTAPEPVTVDSAQGKLYDIIGASARTVVAAIPRDGKMWFFKLRGDTDTVAAAKPTFHQFLASIHFGDVGGSGGQVASVAVEPTAHDPRAGLGLQGVPDPHGAFAAAEVSSDSPKWNVPTQWVEGGPRAMVLKSFSVAGDGGAKAEITISSLQGTGGGLLLNVNRWRGQLGQGPIEAGQLDGLTETVATLDGTATLVDFMGVDAKTSQPSRMVAAIAPHGEQTWFYKLMGNPKTVGGQKDSFVQFVKTVHYP